MRDIVATIQPEQDELVRADLDESVCVQGAPGTGKTAVGLHRAAYLLYTHRQRLRRRGVLILGPNRAFLRYISAVLPALGEVDVEQPTVDELLARVPVRAPTTRRPRRQARRPDGRGAAPGAVRHGSARRPSPLVVSRRLVPLADLARSALRRIVDEVRREAPPYAVGRERRAGADRRRCCSARRRRARRSPGDAWVRKMGRGRPVRTSSTTVWPRRHGRRRWWPRLLARPGGAGRGRRTGSSTAAEQAAIALGEAAALVQGGQVVGGRRRAPRRGRPG